MRIGQAISGRRERDRGCWVFRALHQTSVVWVTRVCLCNCCFVLFIFVYIYIYISRSASQILLRFWRSPGLFTYRLHGRYSFSSIRRSFAAESSCVRHVQLCSSSHRCTGEHVSSVAVLSSRRVVRTCMALLWLGTKSQVSGTSQWMEPHTTSLQICVAAFSMARARFSNWCFLRPLVQNLW